MDALSNPIVLAGGAVALVAIVMFFKRGGGSAKGTDTTSAIDAHVKRGDYGRAADQAMREEKHEVALEYYLRAQQPENAASVAVRLGDYRRAAELFERAKQDEVAARYYDKAGMADKANELRADSTDTSALSLKPGNSGMSSAAVGNVGKGPASRGIELDNAVRELIATSDRSERSMATIQEQARDAADALLSEGELRLAADLYRDSHLDDEAIHLYVNVLGSPGEAAPILARRGNHERAAELYEIAGQLERAAASWTDVARAAPAPEMYIDRIEKLSKNVAQNFLEGVVAERPVSEKSAELHYRLASLFQAQGENARAQTLYRKIVSAVGAYRDIEERLQQLGTTAPVPQSAKPSTADSEELLDLMEEEPQPRAPGPAHSLSDSQLQQLAMQVARAAAEQMRRQNDIGAIMAGGKAIASTRDAAREGGATTEGATRVVIAGLEAAPMVIDLLQDSDVKAARAAAGIDTLRQFIQGRECDLQNIEVYYRLGLAFLARGDWDQALEAFDAVEEASPAYRDAYKRADQIREWQSALGPRMTSLGRSGIVSDTGEEKGRYQLRGELGRGGMAVVYRAVDTVLGRDVALKFLSEELSANEEMRAMFEREARSVAQLNHPNIVTIHDVGTLEGRAFICMEYVEGNSVEQLMDRDNGLTIVESLRVTKQVLDALDFAHRAKIIHRDIKPANMMRSSSGLVKLMDFGLAKSLDSKKGSSMIAGTPAYMPPEQLTGENVDQRVDIFAVGVSLYELLCGTQPFRGLDRSRPPTLLSDHVPAIPPMLDDAVMQAISLDAEDRQADAREFAAPIEQILDAISRFANANSAKPAPAKASAPAERAVPAAVKAGSAPTERLNTRKSSEPTATLPSDHIIAGPTITFKD